MQSKIKRNNKYNHNLLIKTVWLTGLSSFLFFSTATANNNPRKAQAVPGEYIVGLKSAYSKNFRSMGQTDMSRRLGQYVKSYMPHLNMAVVQRASFEKSESAMNSMMSNPDIEFIEPNYIYYANVIPNDTLLSQQWGLRNTGQLDSGGSRGINGVDINVAKAWDVQKGSRNTIVAVIDSGINYNHPDLRNNMWVNEAERNGRPGVDDDRNGVVDDIYGYNAVLNNGNPLDDQSHGSHCAGVIGAQTNNRAGIAGINHNVRLMAIKFLAANGSGSTDGAIRGIDYAVRMGAKILSNSWGGGPYSRALENAIQRANNAGALFVVASGNDGEDNDQYPSYPSSYTNSNVLSVAAINNRGVLARFSNYGRTSVDIAAPGVNVLSTVLRSGYQNQSGTSMATPHVAGVAALVKSQFPTMTASQLKQRLMQTARPLASLRNRVVTAGLVDAAAAVGPARAALTQNQDQQPNPAPQQPRRISFIDFLRGLRN